MTIHLNPEDLGPVSVVAEIRNGDIRVQLAGATAASREALQSALPELRKELQDAGYDSCTLDVQSDTAGQGRNPERPADPSRRNESERDATGSPGAGEHTPGPAPTPDPTAHRGALDVNM